MTERVRALLSEYGVEIVEPTRYPEPGQTRAVKTVERIVRKRGEAETRLMLSTLAETANKGLCLDEVGFWVASDMVRACRKVVETQTDEWLTLWDAIPLAELQAKVSDLRGIVPLRYALDGMIYERIVRRFGRNAAQLDLLDDRR